MMVLVTGGAGYIGAVVVAELERRGHRVRVLDAMMFGGEALLSLANRPAVETHYGDIRNLRAVRRALAGVDAVVHLAALVGEPACDVNPALTEDINHAATCRLVDEARAAGASRFVFASSCSNYGLQDELATESTPLNPLSLYAATKIRAEEYVLTHSDGAMSACVVRLATVFGLAPRMRFNLLVNQLCREAWQTGKVTLYGAGAWRPYIHVADAARAYAMLVEGPADLSRGEVFNVGAENCTKSQVVSAIATELPNVRTELLEQAKDRRDYRVSFDKFCRRFGFTVDRGVTHGVTEVCGALRAGMFADPSAGAYDAWIDEKRLAAALAVD